MKSFKVVFIIGLVLNLGLVSAFAQVERSDIDEKYKWDLSDIYSSDSAWIKAKDSLALELGKIVDFKGTITKSAENLYAVLEYSSNMYKEAVKLYIYASMHSDADTRNMKYSGMRQELEQIFSDYSAKASFIQPEILSSEWTLIERYLNEEPKLSIYKKQLTDLFRQAEHTLSEPEERILALSSMITGTASSIYNTFRNGEMPNPKVVLSSGDTVILNTQGYGKYRAVANREDRKKVFEAYWKNYEKYQASFGEMLYGSVKSSLYNAKARDYESTLEASLYPISIPTEVYHSLVENVNNNLSAFHRYLKIKKRMMGLDTLRYLDLYAPAVKGVELEISYEEAKDIILKALAPLGEEYISTVQKAFNERWIDVYPTNGKRAGAYSNGAFYDGHPYILLNYNGIYEDVGTIAHELGHTMQSYFSNKNQPYPTSDYEIFVAEVASTFNEVLLFEYMLKANKDEDLKLSLLMRRLDEFKGTLFRQTQFAEFELKMHEAAQAGKPLTGEYLSELYTDIVQRYYGHEQGVCFVDDYIHMEWAFIPHFYQSYYVYTYSTSFVASNTLAEGVLNKEEGAIENYMKFLSAGGSDTPIELLKSAGVDMTSPEAFNKTIESMSKVMDEIEKILDKRGM